MTIPEAIKIIDPIVSRIVSFHLKRPDLRELSEEATTEITEYIVSKLHTYKDLGGTSSFQGWVGFVASHRLIDFIRHHEATLGPGHPHMIPIFDGTKAPADHGVNHHYICHNQLSIPDKGLEEYEQTQFAKFLWDDLLPQVLGDRDANIIRLFYVYDTEQSIIGRMYNISQGRVNQIIKSGIARLRSHAYAEGVYQYGVN